MDINDLIRLKRKSKRLKQYDLANILNISEKKFSYIERNKKALLSLDVSILKILCDTLDLDLNLLITEKEKKRS